MIKYRIGYKYQLAEDAKFVLPEIFKEFEFHTKFFGMKNCIMYFSEGYAWNGASGPTIDTKDSMQASLVHDGGYQAIAEGFLPYRLKTHFDELFYQICLKDKMMAPRAWIWKQAVSKFGAKAAVSNKDILIAP